jgi:hypothetical protein
MKFKRKHGVFEQGCVLSESYTATDALLPILPVCRQPLLPACVFVTRDTRDVFCSENLYPNRFFRDVMRSWTEFPLYYETVLLVLFNCALIDIMLGFGLDYAWLIDFRIQWVNYFWCFQAQYFHSHFLHILMSRFSCYWFINQWYFKNFIIFNLYDAFIPVIFSHTFQCCKLNAMSEQCSLAAQCTCERKHVL